MTSDVFIQQEIATGCRAHYHQGVWWQTTATGVCRPLLPFLLITPKKSRPQWQRSYVGYSHLVPPGAAATHRALYWVIEESQLRSYGIDSVNYANRKAVKKAQRSGLVVTRITDLEPLWSDLQAIAISMAERTGYGLPPEYYTRRFEEWKQSIRKVFSNPMREWWGVFSDNKLGAYMYSVHIDETLHFVSTKVHSDFMSIRASDFLYFTMLEYARDLPGCRQVNTGRGLQAAGVDRFKEGHGFKPLEVGEFCTYNLGIKMLLRPLLRYHRRARFSTVQSEQKEPAGVIGSMYRRAIQMAERIDTSEERD